MNFTNICWAIAGIWIPLIVFTARITRYRGMQLVRAISKFDPDELARLSPSRSDRGTQAEWREAWRSYLRTLEFLNSVHPEIVEAGRRFRTARNWFILSASTFFSASMVYWIDHS
jgi:hypothetical protein